jgi:hypothetical protein
MGHIGGQDQTPPGCYWDLAVGVIGGFYFEVGGGSRVVGWVVDAVHSKVRMFCQAVIGTRVGGSFFLVSRAGKV